jgi:hypothetical protein
MIQTDIQQQITELAYPLVSRFAPKELPLFPVIAAAYFRNQDNALKGQQSKEEPLGFGLEEIISLLTPIILTVVASVVTFTSTLLQQAMVTAGADAISTHIKKLFRHPRSKQPSLPPAHPTVLTAEQLALVWTCAYEKALQLKLPEDMAHLLADAIVGRLQLAQEAK